MAARACAEVAADGQPVIIIENVDIDGASAVLRGTAVVWEGTLMFEWDDNTVTWADADIGGPGRGRWEYQVSKERLRHLVSIHPSFQSETPADKRRGQTLWWDDGRFQHRVEWTP